MQRIPTLDVLRLSRTLAPVRKVDLGSGPHPFEDYHGIDVCGQSERVSVFDLASGLPWPFADGILERLHSAHFIEHLPACNLRTSYFVEPLSRVPLPSAYAALGPYQDALCWFMDEAYRVAAPGALFRLRWPSLVFEQTGELSALPFYDPTHRRFIPKQQIEIYFNRAGRAAWGVEQYPLVCDWHVETARQVRLGTAGYEYDYVLRKPTDGV